MNTKVEQYDSCYRIYPRGVLQAVCQTQNQKHTTEAIGKLEVKKIDVLHRDRKLVFVSS